MNVTSRYIAILFEPENGSQKYHILQRYTHRLIYQGETESAIKNFTIYDHNDIEVEENFAQGDAHLFILYNKAQRNTEQMLQVQKIQKDNTLTSTEIGMCQHGEGVIFGSVSIDMKYFALSYLQDIPSEEKNGNGNFDRASAMFYTINNGQVELVSQSKKVEIYNHLNIYSSITFVGKTERALFAVPSLAIYLLKVSDGSILSQVKTEVYQGIELGYYLDTLNYFLLDKKNTKEWTITIKEIDEQIVLTPIEPVIHFEQSEPKPEFSHSTVPYQIANREMPILSSIDGLTSYCIDGKPFELGMESIKHSRSIILPSLKVCYGIRNTDTYDIFVVDLNNLDIQFKSIVNTQRLCFGCDEQNSDSQLILSDLSYSKSDVKLGGQYLQKLSSFLKVNFPNENFEVSKIEDFALSGKFFAFKIDNTYKIFNLETQAQVGCLFGIKLSFSDNSLAFIVRVSGHNFSYWTLNDQTGLFEVKIPIIQNVATRVDFMKGSHTKILIFDDYYQSLYLRDLDTGTAQEILKNLSFTVRDYFVVSQSLIAYNEIREIERKQVSVYVIYNIDKKYPELEFPSASDKLLTIRMSNDNQYVYLATQNEIKVILAKDLSRQIAQYAIKNVHNILIQPDKTFLISKNQSSYQIHCVKTLNPLEKTNQTSSGSLLMKQIFKLLKAEDEATKENAIKAYLTFYRMRLVDSFFGPKGQSFLHQLIHTQNSNMLRIYFEIQEDQIIYMPNFEDESPLTFAARLKKQQHLNLMLDYFNQNPQQIKIYGSDLITLMECSLPNAKLMIKNLFDSPKYYKCALPYSVQSDVDIHLMPQESDSIGIDQAQQITQLLDQGQGDEKVLQYLVTKFNYNFERGSQSSIDFLQSYANEESEEAIRSQLRLIVMHKFQECQFFLKCQAGLFFLLLFSLFIKTILLQHSLFMIITVLLLNSVFLLYELNQIRRNGFSEYFSSIWNFTDFIGFSSLHVVTIAQFFQQLYENEGIYQWVTLMTVVTIICLLLRGMSHLRIFSNLRYLINMIVEIIKDMASFTVILVYWIIGFTVLFFLTSMSKLADKGLSYQDGENSSWNQYVIKLSEIYKLSFGDFSTDEYDTLQWMLFVLSSVFVPLILFNLIIAIMGDTYDRVQTSAKCVDLKEQANLVLEVEGLMHWKRNSGEDKKLLICFNENLGDDAPEAALWEGKIKGLQKQMHKIEHKLNAILRQNTTPQDSSFQSSIQSACETGFASMKEDIIRAVQKEIKSSLKDAVQN